MKAHGWKGSGILVAVTAFALILTGCGGGGGTSSSNSPGASGPATVELSIAAADVTGSAAPAVALSGSETVPSTDPRYMWPEQVDPRIAHVYMDVVKVSLMPAKETFAPDGGDMEGVMQNGNSPDPASPPDMPHFITLVPEAPIPIDLLNLENGKKLARFLNKFDQVPAGTYDKIRVYYKNVKVVLKDGSEVRFHPTANSKFDIHFRQGHELVIPVASDTTQTPDGWIKFFRVKLDVVGLKLMIVGGGKNWNGSKVILRPQIFAEFVPPILYSVAGTATNVSSVSTPPVAGTFDISFGTGPTIVHAAFDNDTMWAYSDNVLGHSSWTVDIPNTTAVPAFRNRAKVLAIGPFDTSLVLQAAEIQFTFPDVKSGAVDNGWRADNTFLLRLATDNVVFPKPDRFTAYYDNGAFPHLPLTQAAVDNNVQVKARGYVATGGIEAFWITVGEITVGP